MGILVNLFNSVVSAIGRKGTLVLSVFLVAFLALLMGHENVSDERFFKFLEFSLWISGIFAGGNTLEHFAKRDLSKS